MNMFFRNLTVGIVVGTLLVSPFNFKNTSLTNHVEASSPTNPFIYELEQKSKEIEELTIVIDQYKKQLVSLENEVIEVKEEIDRVDKVTNLTIQRIQQKELDVEKTRDELFQLYVEIQDLERDLKEREDKFRDRVYSIHKDGNKGWINIIFSSQSFSDLISRVISFRVVVNADNKVIEDYLLDMEKLENKRVDSEILLKKLSEQVIELDELRKKLIEENKTNKENFDSKGLKASELNYLISSLERERGELEIQKEVFLESKNNWEESKELLAESKNHTSRPMNQVSSGMFITPTKGTFTSPYGPRIHPIYGTSRIHHGIDIANNIGTPIFASASGEITYSGWMSGYGNTIIIRHSIDGEVFETLYAHLDKIGVNKGQFAGQGDVIGLMGSTGDSTGSHLHFEIHEGTWKEKDSVNPMKYLK